MSELKAQINMRLGVDLNISVALTTIVDDEAEAKAQGERDARLVTAYLAGYILGAEASSTEG